MRALGFQARVFLEVRVVFRVSDFSGLSAEEIARCLGCRVVVLTTAEWPVGFQGSGFQDQVI